MQESFTIIFISPLTEEKSGKVPCETSPVLSDCYVCVNYLFRRPLAEEISMFREPMKRFALIFTGILF